MNVTKRKLDLLEDNALEGASTVACTREIPGRGWFGVTRISATKYASGSEIG